MIVNTTEERFNHETLQHLCDIEQVILAVAREENESTFSFKDSTMDILHDDIDVDALVTELKLLKNISSSSVSNTFQTVRDVGKALFLPRSHLDILFLPHHFESLSHLYLMM